MRVSYSWLKDEALGRYCRDCINRRFNIRLKPHNCLYEYGFLYCKRCGRPRNIVQDISKPARLRIVLFGR